MFLFSPLKRGGVMKPMKAREQSVYDYVASTIRENGYSPSVRDIKEALGFKSTSNVHMYLARLEERGLLHKESGKSRTLRLGNEEGEVLPARLPILGNVAAGALSFAEENYDGYINFCVPSRLDKESLFALHVRGMSMKDAGILDRDLLIVERTDYAENGDIVVALVENETTVKRYFKENGKFRLQPHNDEFEPIILDSVEILGKVVAVMRTY